MPSLVFLMKRYFSFLLMACVFLAADANAQRGRFLRFVRGEFNEDVTLENYLQGNGLGGDFFGLRPILENDYGVVVAISYTNNFAANPVGGLSQGAAYDDNTSFGVNVDLEKVIHWHGATFTISGLNRTGRNLSADHIKNQFTVQQLFGQQTVELYSLALEQKLFEDAVSLKVGRITAGDDFASSPLYWMYMNNGIDGNPQALPVNTAFSTYPNITWGGRARWDINKELYAMYGLYQASNRVGKRAYQGVDFSMRNGDGVSMVWQVGWTPESFKRPVEVPAEPGSAARPALNKAFKEAVTPTVMKGYPGHFWFGSYYSPWQFSQFLSTDKAHNSYGFYWHADQMVFQETPGSEQGLTLWTAFVYSPQQNISKLPFQFNAGAIYQGLLPYREEDQTMFGVVFGKFSRDYARSVYELGGGYPRYEVVLEWGYRVNFTKFLYVQPNIQWVLNPGGTFRIPNALVLGAQMNVVF